MTQIKAQIIADSKNEFGNRLTTMVCTYPRIIHAEVMTHRMFSRNSASSRAIPFEKMVKSVEENPFIPMAWQKDHKGMQGTEYFTFDLTINQLEKQWLEARDKAVHSAKCLAMGDGYEGLTKQLCNRLLEPFMWHTVIITASEFENFFELRCPQYGGTDSKNKEVFFKSKKDAYNHLINQGVNIQHINLEDTLGWLKINKGQSEIHMMALAEAMWNAMNESTPKLLEAGEWHIPFSITPEESSREAFTETGRIKIATARCARISYTTVGEENKVSNYENDIKLHDNLAKSGHWSPFEHCARCMTSSEYYGHQLTQGDGNPFNEKNKEEFGVSFNFRGFIQYRELLS